MAMSPDGYKGVLNKARDILDRSKEQVEERDKNGLIKSVLFINEVRDSIIECSEEIGKLDMCISQHKNPIKYEDMKKELEQVREELIKLL